MLKAAASFSLTAMLSMTDTPDNASEEEARRAEKDKADKQWNDWLAKFIQPIPPPKPSE